MKLFNLKSGLFLVSLTLIFIILPEVASAYSYQGYMQPSNDPFGSNGAFSGWHDWESSRQSMFYFNTTSPVQGFNSQAYSWELVGHLKGYGSFGDAGGRGGTVLCLNSDGVLWHGSCWEPVNRNGPRFTNDRCPSGTYTSIGSSGGIGNGCADYDISGGIGGDTSPPFKYIVLHVWANDAIWESLHVNWSMRGVEAHFAGLFGGTGYAVVSGNAPPTNVNVGDTFDFGWVTDQANAYAFSYTGPIVCASENQCTATGPGVATITIQANGPSGDGPITVQDSKSITITTGTVSGCTDPTATNYNPSATVDDGSCIPAGGNNGGAVNGICSATHYNCSAGTLGAKAEYPDQYQWWCNGSGGGTNKLCSEMKGSTGGAVNGSCYSAHYNCSAGSLGATAEYPDQWQWWCNGTGGGSNKLCAELKSTGPVQHYSCYPGSCVPDDNGPSTSPTCSDLPCGTPPPGGAKCGNGVINVGEQCEVGITGDCQAPWNPGTSCNLATCRCVDNTPPPPPVNGSCGSNAQTYPAGTTSYSGSYCSSGSPSSTPGFPAPGTSVNWTCLGSNGGGNSQCTASVLISLIVDPQPKGGKVISQSANSNINCVGVCSSGHFKNETVTLKAIPSSSYWKFNGWGGDCASSGTNPLCTLTIDSNKVVSTSFILRLFNYKEF